MLKLTSKRLLLLAIGLVLSSLCAAADDGPQNSPAPDWEKQIQLARRFAPTQQEMAGLAGISRPTEPALEAELGTRSFHIQAPRALLELSWRLSAASGGRVDEATLAIEAFASREDARSEYAAAAKKQRNDCQVLGQACSDIGMGYGGLTWSVQFGQHAIFLHGRYVVRVVYGVSQAREVTDSYPLLRTNALHIAGIVSSNIAKITGDQPPTSDDAQTPDTDVATPSLQVKGEFLRDWGQSARIVAADGVSTLKLRVHIDDIHPESVTVKQPKLGHLKREEGRGDRPLAFDDSGIAQIEYVPPSYLAENVLTERVTRFPSDIAATRRVWAAPVPLTFNYEDTYGEARREQVNILVCRPPVVMVHGFGGNEQTWRLMQKVLGRARWDTSVDTYYAGDGSIQPQSKKLHDDITHLMDQYGKAEIDIAKVDVVAHSMGGLITRNYIQSSYYPDRSPIRKLIMIATPNHGVPRGDALVGELVASQRGKHERAADQLYEGSEFLKQLNEAEDEGRHLHPDVQYAILYGRRRGYWAWATDIPKSTYANNDGVVYVNSAVLNGVHAHVFYDAIHSDAAPLQQAFPQDTPLCNDDRVHDLVRQLLRRDIQRAPLKDVRIVLRKGRQVRMAAGRWSPHTYETVTDFPAPLGIGRYVRTGSGGSALVTFHLDDRRWGAALIDENTELVINDAAPELVRIHVRSGSARFQSVPRHEREIAHFEVTAGGNRIRPRARVIGLDTDFVVTIKDDDVQVHSLDGKLAVEHPQKPAGGRGIKSGRAVQVSGDTEIKTTSAPKQGWWTHRQSPIASNAGDASAARDAAQSGLQEDAPEPPANARAGPVTRPTSVPVFAEYFNGTLESWSMAQVSPEHSDGRLFFPVEQNESIILKEPVPMENVIVEFDGYAEDNGFQIFLTTSGDDYYCVVLGLANNTLSLLIDEGGGDPIAVARGAVYTPRQWHHYAIVRRGDRLEAYCDGELILSAESQKRYGPAGILAFSSQESRIGIDDVEVHRIVSPQAE